MTDRMDIQNVLSQMRSMQLQSQNVVGLDNAETLKVGRPGETQSFSDLMANALDSVNELGLESGRLSTAVVNGEDGATLTQAMIASQKASVAFQAVTEARNKLIGAYEKIMNMPI
jgi:flagellar hook-basal body complex protein FliE